MSTGVWWTACKGKGKYRKWSGGWPASNHCDEKDWERPQESLSLTCFSPRPEGWSQENWFGGWAWRWWGGGGGGGEGAAGWGRGGGGGTAVVCAEIVAKARTTVPTSVRRLPPLPPPPPGFPQCDPYCDGISTATVWCPDPTDNSGVPLV